MKESGGMMRRERFKWGEDRQINKKNDASLEVMGYQ